MIHFFKTEKEFRKWLTKNHSKKNEIWLGFYKKGTGRDTVSYAELTETAICFGWTVSIIKSIDDYCYKAKCVRRKPKSSWSYGTIQKFLKLKKEGRVHESGLRAFNNRDKENSEEEIRQFSSVQLKKFKANKAAWDFFQTMTPSYRRYTTFWVVSAKQAETQQKRLEELIRDSANGSKLERIVKANEKIKEKMDKRYEPGKTPIERAKNIGAVTGAELRSVGIETVEILQSMGWEKVFYKLIELYPERINLNMLMGLVGAVENQHWREIDPDLKAEAKAILADIRRNYRF